MPHYQFKKIAKNQNENSNSKSKWKNNKKTLNPADQRPTPAVGMTETENAGERTGQETVRNPSKITESEEQEC
jgi:hypothetical protein